MLHKSQANITKTAGKVVTATATAMVTTTTYKYGEVAQSHGTWVSRPSHSFSSMPLVVKILVGAGLVVAWMAVCCG